MKHYFTTLFVLFCSFTIFSQTHISQNEILGIPKVDAVLDFNFKTHSKIVPKTVIITAFDQRKKTFSDELLTTLKYTNTLHFDSHTKKLQSYSSVANDQKIEESYTYNSFGQILSIKHKGKYTNYTKQFQYELNGNFSYEIKYDESSLISKESFTKTNEGLITDGITHRKIVIKNGLVDQIVANYQVENSSVETYAYLNQLVVRRNSRTIDVTYDYNQNNDLTYHKETTHYASTKTSTWKYAYVYDKYGNWIISVSLLHVSYAPGVPSFPNPTLRKITYSNGETTGFDDLTSLEVTNHLKELRNQLNNTDIKTASWKRLEQNRFNFYIDGKVVSQEVTSGFMWLSLLVFHKPSKTLFLCEEYAKKSPNEFHEAQKINIDVKEGYWYKNKDGSVAVFTNEGTYLEENKLYSYAPNKNDVYYQGKNESSPVVLLNYKNAEIHKVYAAHNYEEYLSNNIVNTVTKSNCLIGDCENGYAEFKDSDGVRFEVFLQNGKPYGPGLLYKNGTDEVIFTTFEGSYNQTSGFVYSFVDGRYTNFKDDQKKIAFSNDLKTGETLKIMYNNNKPYKQALSNNGNNSCVLGDCYNDIGVKKYDDEVYYFGMFKNGERHGFGHLKYNNGDFYIGNFYRGQFHGVGKYTWKSGAYYMGEYENGKYHGTGVLFYANNSHKAGKWSNGNYLGN